MARLNPTPDYAPVAYLQHRRIVLRHGNEVRNLTLTSAIDVCLDVIQHKGSANDCVLALNMLKDRLNEDIK